jgi:hypothetical protein
MMIAIPVTPPRVSLLGIRKRAYPKASTNVPRITPI